MIVINYLDRLVELEADVRYQESATPGEPEFRYQPGTIPILISAPHGAAHTRFGKHKEEDEYTTGLARLIAEKTGSHCIYARRKSITDPNTAYDAPYKDRVRQICDENVIKFVVDLHGMASTRCAGIALGTRGGRSCTKTQHDLIIQSLKNSGFIEGSQNKLSILWVNHEEFSGMGSDNREPMVKYISERLHLPTAQFEINGWNRIVERKNDAYIKRKFSGNPEMIEKTVNAFIALVDALNLSFME